VAGSSEEDHHKIQTDLYMLVKWSEDWRLKFNEGECKVIWSPRFKMDSVEVGKVKRRATKLIQNLRHLPYENRLRILKLPSLNYKRRRGDMIQTYKIIAGINRIDPELFFNKSGSSQTMGYNQKLTKQHSRLELRSKFFSR